MVSGGRRRAGGSRGADGPTSGSLVLTKALPGVRKRAGHLLLLSPPVMTRSPGVSTASPYGHSGRGHGGGQDTRLAGFGRGAQSP